MLNGLLRVRGITQDDAHIFCTPEQLAPELVDLLAFVLRILRAFGLDEFEAELATRPDKFVGEPEEWDQATEALRQALGDRRDPVCGRRGRGCVLRARRSTCTCATPSAAAGRCPPSRSTSRCRSASTWSTSAPTTHRHRPFMIHRALFGSVERFFGILLEHYAGRLPDLAVAGPGSGAARCATTTRTTPKRSCRPLLRSIGRAGRRRSAPTSRSGARVRQGASSRRCPTSWWSATTTSQAGTVGVNSRGKERPDRGVPLDDFVGHSAGRDRDPRAVSCSVDVTSLERLWAGWRSEYVERRHRAAPRRRRWAACSAPSWRAACPTTETLVVWRHPDGLAAAILNAYPYTSGHLMVMPVRHVGDLDELDAAEGRGALAGCRRGRAAP